MYPRRSVLNFFLFLLFSINFTVHAAIPESALVGSTKGSFSVTPSGTASYNIPIKLPPNVGGVQPSLSLNYDSSGGNGLLGMGWQLSGLSSITRCPKTLERDGKIEGINFDSNDPFCLDGQRLVHISGNEYRTENDNFAKITGGTNGFTVVTPSGQTMKYGDTSNSQIKLKGQTNKIITWALKEVKDSYGNRYTINYTNNGYSSGEYYASMIYMYGGQNLLSHVALVHETRPDVISGYQAGSKYQLSKRLKAVKTYTKNILTKQYLLHYSGSVEPLNTSYVVDIEECDSNGNCLESVDFNWSQQLNDYEDANGGLLKTGNYGSFYHYSKMTGDFNGDGLTDLVWMYSGSGGLHAYTAIGNGDGSFRDATGGQLKSGSFGSSDQYSKLTGDFNGDGIIDLAWMYSGSSGFYAYTSIGKGDGTFNSATGGRLKTGKYGSSDQYSKSASDFDGDGLTDLVWMYSGSSGLYAFTALSKGDGSFYEATGGQLKTGSFGSSSDYSKHVGDFDGDGLGDIAWIYSGSSGLHAYTALGKGDGGFGAASGGKLKSGSFGSHDAYQKSIGDFNGDGLSDLVWIYSGASGFHVYTAISKGNGLFQLATGGKLLSGSFGDYSAYSKFTIDINADGFSDLIWMYSGSSGLYSYRALGLGDGSFETPSGGRLKSGAFGSYSDYDKSAGDFDGDGLTDLLWMYSGRSGLHAYTSMQENDQKHGRNWVSEIETVSGKIEIGVNSLVNSEVYKKGTSQVLNEVNLQSPVPVVGFTTQPDGLGGTITTYYKYEGLRYDRYAKRSLGFSKTIIENHKTDVRSETTYNQSYPYVGMVTSTLTELISSGQDLSISSQSNFAKLDTSGKKTYFPYASDQTKTTYMLNDNLLQVGSKTVATHSDFNSSGQLTKRIITTSGTDSSGTYKVETNNTYGNGYSNRRQGEITNVTVKSTDRNQDFITRKSSFDYDWSKGHLIKEVIEPGHADPSITRVSHYGYDSFGNRTSTVTCDGNYENSCTTSSLGARFSTVQFSTDGLFAQSATNALGHSTSSVYDARFGVVTSTTDINGLTTYAGYDSLGRKISSTNAFDQTATVTREWCDASCPTVQGQEAYSKVTRQAPNAPTSIVYFDQYNREIRKEREGFNTETILVDTEYDDYGRVKRTSEPYFDASGVTVFWNTPTYDDLGRKISVSTPTQDGGYDTTSSISYQGFTTEITDALGRKVKEVKNVIGKVVKMTDKASNDTLYEYDALGNLTKTTDSAGNEVVLKYDVRGRKTEMNDPDMGTWKYKYNTFDQLVEQTDAKNQVTKMFYDSLGRMTSRTDAYGTSNAKTSTWSFYTTPAKSKGKLYQKKAANGDYTRYTYNSTYGQLVTTDQKIGSKIFTVKNGYDAIGRVSSITYPSTTAYSTGFKVIREYNSKGFLGLVRKDDNSKTYWQANALSPRGQLEAASYGNGTQELSAHSDGNGWLIASQVYKGNNDLYDITYEFNAVGNIKKRIDALQQNMTEEFDYDDLDRLTDSSIYGGPSGVSHLAKSYGYDDLGNITSKSDVGSYSYNGCGGRPHAVCNAGGTVYSYDANGNMLTGVKGSTTTQIGYTAFNKSNFMKKGSNYAVTFNYDADRNRNYKSRIQGNGSLNLQTYYVGTSGKGAKIFEQEVSSTTGTKNIHYIYGAGGQAVATHITEGTAKRTEYFHRDHLGSVALVTNDAGQAVSPVSFDAWGKRRNTNWSDNSTGTGLPDITGNVGFTGQETIKEIGLIHMNGRIYDPNLGRFLSADPLIQAPYNSQSYNRYSYVMNNPLSLVDPSGYSWLSKKWKSVKKAARKIDWKEVGRFTLRTMACGAYCATAYSKPGQRYIKKHKWAQQAMSIVAGAADAVGCSGACSAANAAMLTDINGGDFGDVLKSAGMAYASYLAFSSVNAQYGKAWSMSRVIANGVTGGAVSKAYGGKFADGFVVSASLAAAAYAYSEISSKYNSTGEPHFGQEGKSDVGKQLTTSELDALQKGKLDGLTYSQSDQHPFMKGVGRHVAYGDAFAEFHDGFHDLSFVPTDPASLIVTMPHSYALTVMAAAQPAMQSMAATHYKREDVRDFLSLGISL